MSSIKVNFEIGHEASPRSKKTPEGFTHDWEVFVRGLEGADISHFVDKVVFHLHETFPKPRRVVKEPPFSIKESGYAGFIFPIEIYLKNKDEPKKIKFCYDFTLQQSGSLKDRYIFHNPNDDFKKKLLKGGGIAISNNAFYTNPDQEGRSRDSFTEDKPQLLSKPKLSTDIVKKHKVKEPKDEISHRSSSFENLFGAPLHKPAKVSPDPKKIDKSSLPTIKSEKKDRDRSNAEKKLKHEHKDVKPEKVKVKEEKDKIKPEKEKNHNKDQEKSKDKSNKRSYERPPSPETVKRRCLSPSKRVPSPPQRSSSASSFKEEYKPSKLNIENFEQRKVKTEDKVLEIKDKEVKEKKKKEKKSHDRDKERKEKKDHKKDMHKPKESPKEQPKEIPKDIPKPREVLKEKEMTKDLHQTKEKQPKIEKPINKFSIENLKKTPPPDNEERYETQKSKERGDTEKKHKHKKKDKKRDESREKHKESNKEKKQKEKVKELPIEKPTIVEHRDTPVPKENTVPELASPISIDTASQCSSSGLAKPGHIVNEDMNSSHSDSESSIIQEEEETKVKIEIPSPISQKEPSPEPELEPEMDIEPEPEPEPEPPAEVPSIQKEKSKKHKDKSSKKEEKRRKRKAAENRIVNNDSGPSNDPELGETSGTTSETKLQDNGVSSSLGEDAEPGDLSPDYMVQLRGLQQRIMMIKNNEELERVVNLIAETGRYEVTTQTFDFDLCLLDRSTVQQLIQLVGC